MFVVDGQDLVFPLLNTGGIGFFRYIPNESMRHRQARDSDSDEVLVVLTSKDMMYSDEDIRKGRCTVHFAGRSKLLPPAHNVKVKNSDKRTGGYTIFT